MEQKRTQLVKHQVGKEAIRKKELGEVHVIVYQ